MDRLPALSDRALAFLRGAGARRAPGPDPSAALATAAAQGLPVSPALRSFEEQFGGLAFTCGRRRVLLGVGAVSAEDAFLRPAPDDDRVLVGREDEWTDLSMSPDGRLWSHGPDGAPWPLAGSATRYVEHLALLATAESVLPDPFLTALPPGGPSLAGVLGWTPDAASDDHLAAWSGAPGWLIHRRRGHPYATGYAELRCGSLEATAEVLVRLHRALPGLRVAVTGWVRRTEQQTGRDGWGRVGVEVPDPECWSEAPGVLRFDYLGEGLGFLGQPDRPGTLWLVPGPEGWRLEQVVLAGPEAACGVVRWDSHDARRSLARLFLPVHPPGGATAPPASRRAPRRRAGPARGWPGRSRCGG